jgi:hypothetical protein
MIWRFTVCRSRNTLSKLINLTVTTLVDQQNYIYQGLGKRQA